MADSGNTRATAKNIVLCSDGTGNAGGKKNGTNVWRLYLAVDTANDVEGETRQIAFHDDGVGSEDYKLLKAVGGAMGYGLSRNIRQLYTSLVRSYNPGDQIFLFGFSRGAYTVRSLAGFIHHCGILRRNSYPTRRHVETAIEDLYRVYRRTDWTETDKDQRTALLEGFSRHDDADVRITFLGVWDTVDAIGVPVDEMRDWLRWLPPLKQHEHDLNSSIDYAYHALAIDDARQTFHPNMFDEAKAREDATVEQVWFSGVHSNVGGSYPKDQMALVALDWMMEKAETLDAISKGRRNALRFTESLRKQYHKGANVDGKLYDSRAGLAAYYRFKPRNIVQLSAGKLGRAADRAANGGRNTLPVIHQSAFARVRHRTGGYAPFNLPPKCLIDPCDDEDNENEGLHDATGSPLESVTALAMRFSGLQRLLYFVLLAVTIALVLVLFFVPTDPHVHAAVKKLSDVVRALAPSQLANVVEGLFQRLDWLFFFVGAYGFLYVCRSFLRALKTNLAGMGWRHWSLSRKIERMDEKGGDLTEEQQAKRAADAAERDWLAGQIADLEGSPAKALGWGGDDKKKTTPLWRDYWLWWALSLTSLAVGLYGLLT